MTNLHSSGNHHVPDQDDMRVKSQQLVCKAEIMLPVEALLVMGTGTEVVADIAGETDVRRGHLRRQHFVMPQ